MVLDDASTSDTSFSSPTAPSNDMDQYSGDQSPTILSTRSPSAWPISRPNGLPPLYINFSSLPMPWSPMTQAQSTAAAQKTMGDTLQKASDEYYKVAGRPFEQQEGDAMVYHLAKALRLASLGPPMGILTAGVVAFRPKAWATFRFPGWTPGEKFNPDKLFVLKGSVARAAWHALRFNAYGILGLLAGEVLMGSYAMTVANVGRLKDPRLKEVNETLRKISQERMKEKGLPIEDRTEGKRGQESLEMARQRSRAQKSGTRAVNTGDDMSPTSGSFREDLEGAQSGGDMGMLSDSQIQQLQQQEKRSEELAYQASNSPQASAPTPNASRSSQPSNSQPQPASSNSGSAWERLRQQAGQQQRPQSAPQQPSRGMQRPNNDYDDTFGLGGGSNEERSRPRAAAQSPQNAAPSRSDAQREFDAQLDRERQGEGNTRW